MREDPDLAMFLAAVNGDASGVEAALQAGADPNKWEDASKIPPLGWAVRMGSGPCVELLLKAGADPWAPGAGNVQSAIGYAMEYERWGIMERLIDGCPDPKMKTEHRLRDSWKTAVIFAKIPALGLLVRAGIDIEESVMNSGGGALACAAYDRREEAVEALLALGADPNASFGPSKSLSSPAMRAVEACWPRGLEILLGAGADADGPQGPGGLAKEAVGSVKAHKRGDIARMLSIMEAHGADLLRPGMGEALLLSAAMCGNVDAIRWLCERGVDPAKKPDGQLATALVMARGSPDLPASALVEAYALSAHERRELGAGTPPSAPASKPPRM